MAPVLVQPGRSQANVSENVVYKRCWARFFSLLLLIGLFGALRCSISKLPFQGPSSRHEVVPEQPFRAEYQLGSASEVKPKTELAQSAGTHTDACAGVGYSSLVGIGVGACVGIGVRSGAGAETGARTGPGTGTSTGVCTKVFVGVGIGNGSCIRTGTDACIATSRRGPS